MKEIAFIAMDWTEVGAASIDMHPLPIKLWNQEGAACAQMSREDTISHLLFTHGIETAGIRG